MSNLIIKKNGTPIMTEGKHEKAREALASLMSTQNPGAKGVESALQALGGKAYAESFGTTGKPSDVFEVYEDDKLTAKGIRKNVVAKMHVSLTREDWLIDVFTVKSEKKSATPQEIPVV